ncbi:hypothetical protein H113_06304 [Trichophyton rubrum MR1459]|nr:hypothetical protein H113_06304 [Trichophyton rubrum MR1459]
MGVISFLRSRHIRARNDQVTNAAQLTLRQSLWPLTIVTILFFLWGFAYGLLDTLNKHFQNTLGITRTRSSGLQAAYFGAYPLASLGYANWMLRNWGYKSVFILGLSLYGIGALCMWPAGLHQSFGGFCGATFVIGSGLGSLETAANPYLSVCGPPKYAEIRINFAQAFNAIGTVVGPVLGSYVFFTTTADNVNALQRVQWVYLAIAIFVFCLAAVFYISDIPEVTDADMEYQVALTHVEDNNDSFWKKYQLFHAAFAQFLYVGSQVAIASYFINYSVETRANTSSALGAKFLAGAQGAFTVGRFSGALLMKFIRARWIFLVYLAGVFIFLAASTTQRGNTGVAMLFMVLFFESVCFPTIVALGIRGLGKHYKRGSGFIVAGVSGGAAVPPLLGYVADLHDSTGFAMIVPTILMAVAWTYAICVNFVPSYRDPADKIGDSDIGITDAREDEERKGAAEVAVDTAGVKEREINPTSFNDSSV